MAETSNITVKTPAQFEDLFSRAHAAGMAAGQSAKPTPMHVVNATTGHRYEPVMDGVCGFAWVTVRPGTSSFARWLTKTGKGRKAYNGGIEIWVGEFNQSMERKERYADAFAEVLRTAGINAYGGSRMD